MEPKSNSKLVAKKKSKNKPKKVNKKTDIDSEGLQKTTESGSSTLSTSQGSTDKTESSQGRASFEVSTAISAENLAERISVSAVNQLWYEKSGYQADTQYIDEHFRRAREEVEQRMQETEARCRAERAAESQAWRAESKAMIDKAFKEEDLRKRGREAFKGRDIGVDTRPDQLADAFDQEVTNLQSLVDERGPKVEGLLSDPQARDLFTLDNISTLFGALCKDPGRVKAEILSDILRLEEAQIASWGDDVDEPEVRTTRDVARELLVCWGPKLAREYWDIVVGAPDELYPIEEDKAARFSDLLE